MNTQEFVNAIQRHVIDVSVAVTVEVLLDPPGRRPDPGLVEMGRWFRGLAQQDRAMVERLLAMVARDTVFGVFVVLDGARKIDPAAEPEDYFELRLVRGEHVDIISTSDTMLHELLE